MTRDEFIDLVYDELNSDGDNNRANRIIDAADSYAQPEREKGEWITNLYAFGEDRYECDQCHHTALHCYDFCPNCGADMRGKKDD